MDYDFQFHPMFSWVPFPWRYVRYRPSCRGFRYVDIVTPPKELKHEVIAELNLFECIRTNVITSENSVAACLRTDEKKVVGFFIDTVSSPLSLVGLILAQCVFFWVSSLTFMCRSYGKNKSMPVADGLHRVSDNNSDRPEAECLTAKMCQFVR